MTPQDMEVARALVDLWRENPVPVSEGVRILDIATAIAQARVNAEREAHQVIHDGLLYRDALAAQVEALRAYVQRAADQHEANYDCEFDGSEAETALAVTPAASLIAHDNALIERCALSVCSHCGDSDNQLQQLPNGRWVHVYAAGDYVYCGGERVRALKTDSEGSTT